MSTGRYSGILVELVRGARVAPLTAFTCFACLVVTAGAWLEGGAEPESWEHMARWGALSGPDIWEGRIWGLLTSVFVHGDLLHLVFNVYWLWTFGLVLERVLPRVALLGLLVAAGVVSSAAELAVTGDPGIGVSGVLYAWFGVLWSARRAVPSFAAALDQRTIGLFLVWLVVCIVATHLEYWNIGNAAHLGGLLFGVGVGPSFLPGRWRAQARAATVIGSAGVLVAAFWCPWNAEWTFQRAIRQHERGELEQAERSYRRSLEQGVEPERAWGALAYLAQAAD
ncbi:MAG TPA: rhomboid family intramembrane serine protease, partial [Planctomycetota bacterium]